MKPLGRLLLAIAGLGLALNACEVVARVRNLSELDEDSDATLSEAGDESRPEDAPSVVTTSPSEDEAEPAAYEAGPRGPEPRENDGAAPDHEAGPQDAGAPQDVASSFLPGLGHYCSMVWLNGDWEARADPDGGDPCAAIAAERDGGADNGLIV